MSCYQKKDLYLLVIILGDLINYKDRIINFKIGLIDIVTKERLVIIFFNILFLKKNKVVLGIL